MLAHTRRQDGRGRREGQVEAARHLLRGGTHGLALLQRAGKVKAAEHGLELERIFLEQGGDEGAQGRLDGGKLQRKGKYAGRHRLALPMRHVGQAQLRQAIVQFIETLVEKRQQVRRGQLALVGHGGAPDALAFAAFGIGKKLREAGDQVRLGKHDVQGGEHFQAFDDVLHALAQAARQLHAHIGVASQFGDADGDEDAVDGCLAPVFFQQVEKAEPLAAMLVDDRITSRRVEHDAIRGEKPVAVARAAHALHDLAVSERELQARMQDGAALAGGRIADDHVPRQFVQGGGARFEAQPGRFDGLDGGQHARAYRVEFTLLGAVGRRGRGRLRGGDLGLVEDGLPQRLGVAPRAAPAPQPQAQPGDKGQQQQGQRPDQRHFQHLGPQIQEHGQRHEAEDGQIAAVGEEIPDSSQHDEPRVRSQSKADSTHADSKSARLC